MKKVRFFNKQRICKINEWLKINKVSLYVLKSKYMTFQTAKKNRITIYRNTLTGKSTLKTYSKIIRILNKLPLDKKILLNSLIELHVK